jgi:hypothetical protein
MPRAVGREDAHQLFINIFISSSRTASNIPSIGNKSIPSWSLSPYFLIGIHRNAGVLLLMMLIRMVPGEYRTLFKPYLRGITYTTTPILLIY